MGSSNRLCSGKVLLTRDFFYDIKKLFLCRFSEKEMKMLTVQLIAKTDVDPTTLSSHAAKVCYAAQTPEMGQLIDVRSRLFATGHHTTLEHNYFTFHIDGVSISDVVFGLHLNMPYYNTDQRSGRFSKMYQNPDFSETEAYLAEFFSDEDWRPALSFVKRGMDVYHKNILPLSEYAAECMWRERPLASEKYVAQNAPKFAQEQLRMFVSQIMPTALDYTLDLSALCALWRVSWSRQMRKVTDLMRDEVLKIYPELAYMFDEKARQNKNWAPAFETQRVRVCEAPVCRLTEAPQAVPEAPIARDSVDVFPFSPFAMADNVSCVRTQVDISCATMGQDQRHRAIRRSAPVFTGAFYLPPLLRSDPLKKEAQALMEDYLSLVRRVSPALAACVAPYGAMVRYEKRANLNALKHEQAKRLCWCAQEEIFEISRQLREQLLTVNPALADMLAPPCYGTGRCAEGARFCGRKISRTPTADYFQKRCV